MMVDGVVESPGGAHFTSCVPDYGRDEPFQAEYVAAAKDDAAWAPFARKYLAGTEDDYQAAVSATASAGASA
jgi:glutaconate CoA-transferase subunit A